MSVVHLLVLLGAVTACKRMSADECKVAAADVGAYLKTLDTEVTLFQPSDIVLPIRDELPRTAKQAPIVEVHASSVVYQGESVTMSALGERLTAAHAKIAEDIEIGRFDRSDPPDARQLFLRIDGAAPWSAVVDLATTASAAGFTRPSFVFGRTVAWKKPPPSPVDARIEAAIAKDEGANKATRLATIGRSISEDCPALLRAFGEVGLHEGNKAEMLVAAVPAALAECQCAADPASVRNYFFYLLANPNPVSVLAVELAADGTRITRPAAMPWREAQGALTPTATRVQLSVE